MNEMLKTFKALSDENRLRILKLLEHGELCVCEIVAAFGAVLRKAIVPLAAAGTAAVAQGSPKASSR